MLDAGDGDREVLPGVAPAGSREWPVEGLAAGAATPAARNDAARTAASTRNVMQRIRRLLRTNGLHRRAELQTSWAGSRRNLYRSPDTMMVVRPTRAPKRRSCERHRRSRSPPARRRRYGKRDHWSSAWRYGSDRARTTAVGRRPIRQRGRVHHRPATEPRKGAGLEVIAGVDDDSFREGRDRQRPDHEVPSAVFRDP